ncbi:transposase [Nocardia salmonicida]|uniref:transposase n=1 Tax=Nocardia salmonicida TaxID=53431 RepID=UPI001041DCC3
MLARRGFSVSRKRVERRMRGAGLQGAFLRKKVAAGLDPAGSACHPCPGPGQS